MEDHTRTGVPGWLPRRNHDWSAERWAILAGAGYAWAADPGVGRSAEHTASPVLAGAVRVTPFSRRGRGLAVELRAQRFTRNLGSLTWVLTPGVSWTF